MAQITKVGKPSYSQLLNPNGKVCELYAGEDIAAGDACYVKASDGLIYRSDGSAVADAAMVVGFAAKDALVAQKDPVTLVAEAANWAYGTGLTPGKRVYLSGSVLGGLADAASTGGTGPIGVILDSQRIRLWPSRY